MKTNPSIENGSISSSEMQPSGQNSLLDQLLKRQYPMSQDEQSAKPEVQQGSNLDYHARMDKWLEDHSNEW